MKIVEWNLKDQKVQNIIAIVGQVLINTESIWGNDDKISLNIKNNI